MRGRGLVVAVALVVVVGMLSMTAAGLVTVSPGAITVSDTVSDSPNGSVTVTPGETVTVHVWANVTGVRGYQSTLTFDPAVVQVSSVSGTADFGDPVTEIDNESGRVALNQIRTNETNDPVFAAVTLTVAADASGSTTLAFVDSETALADSDGDIVGPDTFNGVELTVEDAETTDDGSTDDSTSDNSGSNDTDGDTNDTNDSTDDSDDSSDSDDSTNDSDDSSDSDDDTNDSSDDSTSNSDSTNDSDDSSDSDDNSDDSTNDNSDDSTSNSDTDSGGDTTDSTDDSSNATSDTNDSSGGGNSSSNETTLSLGPETGVSSTAVETGDPVEMTLVVENTGENATNESVNVTAGGETIFETDVVLSSGAERTIEFAHTFSDPGEYDIAVSSSALGTDSIDTVAVDDQSETDTVTAVADGATDSETSGVSETDSPTATDDVTATSDSGSNTSSLAGIGIGVVLLFATGTGLVVARLDGYGPASSGESTTDSDPDATTPVTTLGDADTELSAVSDALADAGIEVVDIEVDEAQTTLAYATAAANPNAARVEIRAIVRSYTSAVDERLAGKRLEATVVEDDETLGTWHIRSDWLRQLEEGALSVEKLDQKVFETVTRIG